MKKNELFAGILIGSILTGAAAFAAQYTATENPFPIKLNWQDVQIEGYNINDSTYFKLRDIADVVGGFTVDFNNDTIQLAKDGYVYDNTVSVSSAAETALKSFTVTVTGVPNTDLGKTYDNVKFKLVDFSEDGVPELLAVGLDDNGQIAQAEVFYYNNGDIVRIFNNHCQGYGGGAAYPVVFDGKAYICGDSYSSSTGFLKSLEQYDGSEWQQVQYSRTEFDRESGRRIGYTVNNQTVSEDEYNNFNKKIEDGIMSPDDFVPANQL